MRIEGLVTCVGEKYAEILHKALPIWVDTLDSVTIVTDGSTPFKPPRGVKLYWTELFKAHGAFFNKGAALSSAYVDLDPEDWVLHFDADIIPPKDWRRQAEGIIRPGFLYGCERCYEDGTTVYDPPPFPYGFFHLWHAKDPRSWVRPLWDCFWPSAGHYEISFIDRWPSHSHRVRLPFKVIHPAEPRSGWFGDTPEGKARMEQDRQIGHHEARINKTFTLQVPDYQVKVCFSPLSPEAALDLMRNIATTDPFYAQIKLATQNCKWGS